MQLLTVADLRPGNDLGTRGNKPDSSEGLNHSARRSKQHARPGWSTRVGQPPKLGLKNSQFSAGLDPCLSLSPQKDVEV